MEEETDKPGGKEVASDAARGRKYRQKNPERAKRNNMKLSINLTERRLRDESFDGSLSRLPETEKESPGRKRRSLLKRIQDLMLNRISLRDAQRKSHHPLDFIM